MQRLGLLGGLGPESTVLYYKEIIKRFKKNTGSDTFPELLINSVDMSHVLKLVAGGDYERLTGYLAGEIEKLVVAGAQFCAISSNTPHIVFENLHKRVAVPMVSIVETAAERARSLGLKRILLIGTKFTMENDFYHRCFAEKKMEIVVPGSPKQETIHDIIFPELEAGIVRPEKKATMLSICSSLIQNEQLDGILLGCTELPLMLGDRDFDVAVLDTARLHIEKLVDGIVGG